MNDISKQIKDYLQQSKIVLFMKGSKEFPLCGFSARVVFILQELGCEFLDINVLEDEMLREGIKTFTNWPTIPQLYINQEFIGGCDIVSELYHKGELQQIINKL
jgi:monothiol glutaredoxin